jgi:hypothetical protein
MRIIRIITVGAAALIAVAAVAGPAVAGGSAAVRGSAVAAGSAAVRESAVAAGAAGVAVAAQSRVGAYVSTPSAVTVSPSTALAGGEVVKVAASGITPLASVQVIQCDSYDGHPEDDCSATTTTTASGTGQVKVNLTLQDPVFRSQEIGDAIPIYCRADQCRVFLAWTDASARPQDISSGPLKFKGAPATIVVSTSMNLHGRQLVGVRGTAFGANGHQVMVLEEACYAIVQGSGCYGQLPAVTSVVTDKGRYFVHYRVRQFLADGTDCNDPGILGSCELSVIVLTKGQPDNSFGFSSIGEPAAQITFLPKKPTS